MIFEQIPIGPMQNFAYLIADKKTREAAIVDPGWDAPKLLETAKKHNVTVQKILITHTDFDHIKALPDLARETKATVFVHHKGIDDIKRYGITNIETIDEGSIIMLGSIKISVICTPGHRPMHVCFLFENKIITGDTLFVEGCGRVDLPGSDIKAQWGSLQKLKSLSEDTEIYPGHDYGSAPFSTIGKEKKNNPYLRLKSYEEFIGIR